MMCFPLVHDKYIKYTQVCLHKCFYMCAYIQYVCTHMQGYKVNIPEQISLDNFVFIKLRTNSIFYSSEPSHNMKK